jgi:hypothetical protein
VVRPHGGYGDRSDWRYSQRGWGKWSQRPQVTEQGCVVRCMGVGMRTVGENDGGKAGQCEEGLQKVRRCLWIEIHMCKKSNMSTD